MFLETQGVVEHDGVRCFEYRVFHLDGAISLAYEPVDSGRTARAILTDARARHAALIAMLEEEVGA